MFQLMEQPDPRQMFHSEYAFFSGTSEYMKRHFAAFAGQVTDRSLKGLVDPLVVEIGSNDGIMLRHFAARGLRHLGVEPASNVAAVASEQGIETLVAFFSEATAHAIRAEHGAAHAVLAANVMSHIATLPDVAAGVAALLARDGVLVIESPYLGAVVEKTTYDQIYDEHVYLFSATSVANAFRPHGLELIDVVAQHVHGGSMRWTLGRSGEHRPSAAVDAVLAAESALGLDEGRTFERFRERCEASRDALRATLTRCKEEGARIVGYGATAKSTTVLNYGKIGPEIIEYISDTTPIKHGKLSPGMHVPIRPHADFVANYPDYALLFAWNHSAEIMAKEQAFVAAGGKWLSHVAAAGTCS
jgi:methylation protein EvaC